LVKKLPEEKKFDVLDIRLGIKLNYVIPVINFGEFAYALIQSNYKVEQNQTVKELFAGQKGTTEIYLDGLKGVFGAHSMTVENAVTTVKEMMAITNKTFDLTIEEFVSFYEFEMTGNYKAGSNTYKMLSKLYQDSAHIKQINHILGGDYSQVSIKIAPSARTINDLEWQEMTIEPKVNSNGNIFYTRLLVRSQDMTTVASAARKFEENVTNLIEQVLAK
jgi:hypothetical protein